MKHRIIATVYPWPGAQFAEPARFAKTVEATALVRQAIDEFLSSETMVEAILSRGGRVELKVGPAQ